MGSQGVLLSQRKRWRRTAPSNAFTIDWSHPLTSGLIMLWLPGTSVTPQLGNVGAPTYGTTYDNGQGTKWGAGSDRRRWFSVPAISSMGSGNFRWPATLASVGRYSSDYTTICSWGLQANRSNNPPYDGIVFVSSNGSVPYASWGSATVQQGLNFPSTANLQGEHVHVIAVSSGLQELYDNGARVASSSAIVANPTMTAPTLSLDFYPFDAARYLRATKTMMALWNRYLTANEVAEFSADPFCFLRY